ncbi:MAG: hypothetical protein RIQ79_236 [Verrucomicrobiota bacterium]|jgi:hypothetical protein
MKLIRALKTYLRSKFGGSDVSRWSQDESLHPNWDERTRMLGRGIRERESVIEFGAGKMALKAALPKGCKYLGTDIVSREPGMLVVDLNQLPLPDLGTHDVAIFSGVFEYLNDVPAVIAAVKPLVGRIATSYTVLENKPELIRRRGNGCVNDFTREQFVALFTAAGFKLVSTDTWREQVLFFFEKN